MTELAVATAGGVSIAEHTEGANRPVFRALAAQDENHQIEQVGQRLRGMMSWVKPAVPTQHEEQKVNQRVQNLEFRE